MGKKRQKSKSRHGWQSLTLCISTTMVLMLVGLVVLSVLAAQRMSRHIRENFTVTVMLSDSMTVNDGHRLCRETYHRHWARHIDYISKAEALEEQTQALGTDPSEFAGINPFLASLEIRLKEEYTHEDSLKKITKILEKNKDVVEVSYQKDLMDTVNRNLSAVSLVMLVLAALLTCVSFSLINNTVKLGVYAHRFSIRIMKLVGASWSFIRRPFLKKAMANGFISALIADGIIIGGVYLLYREEPGASTFITWEMLAITAAVVFVFGLLLSVACTYLSVNKFLKMKASELYKI